MDRVLISSVTGGIGQIASAERLLRYEGEQILPGDSTAPANAGGLLLVGMTPGPEVETAFNAWYDAEHIPPSLVSLACYARAGSGRMPAARSISRCIISRRQASWIRRNGRTPAARPRCPNAYATRSATAFASCAETYAQVDLAAAD